MKILQAEVLADRKKLSETEWLEVRRKGIGGSDAGAIAGLNPFKSAYSVYCDKLNLSPEQEDNEAMRQGRDFEEYVAMRFSEESGKKVKKCNYILRHSVYPFMLADVDRLVVGENAGLECKTTNVFNKTNYEEGEIPLSHYVQCVHYMAVTGADRWYLETLPFGRKPFLTVIERDEKEIRHLIELERLFWEENVGKQIEPMPDGSKRAAELLKKLYPSGDEEKECDLFAYETELSKILELESKIKEMEKERETCRQRVQAYMGESALGTTASGYKVTWKNQNRALIDAERLKSEQPEIYGKYLKNTTSRIFRIKKI